MKTIKDYNLNNKRIIIRCDLNVPIKNGIITDNNKLKESIDTIKYAIVHNAKVILMSHLGRIKTEEDKKENSLYPVSIELSKLLNRKIIFSKDTRSEELSKLVNNMKKKDIILIENTRYEDLEGQKESTCDLELSKYWASLGEIFINDAYGTAHRAHASNVGIAKLLPNGIGFLVEKEIEKVGEIVNCNTHPYIIIMGGKKISDKIKLIETLANKCDYLLIGGGMSYTFLKAKGFSVGDSIVDQELISFCKSMIEKYSQKIILPIDTVTVNHIDENAKTQIKDINNINGHEIGVDIGPKTIELFKQYLNTSKRVIMNGPLGIFEIEKFAKGTNEIYKYLIENNIKTLIGGGDTAASLIKLNLKEKFYHVSTGGGATLEYLEGKILPGIEVINHE